MKRLFSLLALAFSLQIAPAVSTINLLVDTNGTVIAPTNFFGANIAALTNALHFAGYTISGIITNNQTGVTLSGTWTGPVNGTATNAAVAQSVPTTLPTSSGSVNLLGVTTGALFQPSGISVSNSIDLYVAGKVNALSFTGNGASLNNLTGSNVVGTVASATMATTSTTATNGPDGFPILTSASSLSSELNAEATAYLNAASIYDRTTRREIDECISEMKTGNGAPFWTNCVALLSYQSRLGTNFNLVGNAMSFTGPIVQNINGLVLSGTTTGMVALITIPANYTICVRYKVTQSDVTTWQGRGYGSPIWILKDTNGLSADSFNNEQGAGLGQFTQSETNGGAARTVSMFKQNVSTWDNDPQVFQAAHMTFERSGTSNYWWANSVAAAFSNGGMSATNAANTNQINQLAIGGNSAFPTYRAASLEIDSIAVFNKALTSSQVASAYRAMAWLVPGNSFDVIVCDSRGAQVGYNSGGFQIYNDWPMFYFMQNPGRYYINFSRGGATSRNMTNFTGWGALTNLPNRKYTDTEVTTDIGINDYYINSSTPNEVCANLVTALTPAKNFGARVGFSGVYDVAVTNDNWAYSTINLTNQLLENHFFKTNAFCNDYYPHDAYVTQWLLNKNNPFHFSLDGVHFGYTGTNMAVQLRMAAIYSTRGKPWPSAYSAYGATPTIFDPTNTPSAGTIAVFDGTNWLYTTDGSSLSNLNASNITGQLTASQLPFVEMPAYGFQINSLNNVGPASSPSSASLLGGIIQQASPNQSTTTLVPPGTYTNGMCGSFYPAIPANTNLYFRLWYGATSATVTNPSSLSAIVQGPFAANVMNATNFSGSVTFTNWTYVSMVITNNSGTTVQFIPFFCLDKLVGK